jgi:hypothetical protein
MNYKKINFDEDNEIYKRKKMTIIVGTNNLDGEIINIDENYISLKLNKPACISSNSIIILCHKSSNSFQIAAYGYLEEHEFEVKEAVAVAIISALSIITNSESDVDDI